MKCRKSIWPWSSDGVKASKHKQQEKCRLVILTIFSLWTFSSLKFPVLRQKTKAKDILRSIKILHNLSDRFQRPIFWGRSSRQEKFSKRPGGNFEKKSKIEFSFSFAEKEIVLLWKRKKYLWLRSRRISCIFLCFSLLNWRLFRSTIEQRSVDVSDGINWFLFPWRHENRWEIFSIV